MGPVDVDLDEEEAPPAKKDKARPLSERIGERIADWIDEHRDFWSMVWIPINISLVGWGWDMWSSHSHTGIGPALLFLGAFGVAREVLRLHSLQTSTAVLDIMSEQQCATHTEVIIDLDQVLRHRSLARAFRRLQALKRIPPEQEFEKWRDSLLVRYKERTKVDAAHPAVAHVEFEFSGGQFTVDKEPRRFPILDRQILIPDPSMKRHGGFSESEEFQYNGVRVRLVIIGGLLKVQLGRWDKELAGKKNSYGDWTAWDTVTRFPLILNAGVHRFPPRFLFMEYSLLPKRPKPWEPSAKKFWRMVADYRRELAAWMADRGEYRLQVRMARAFQTWLAKEHFKSVEYLLGDDGWENRYMRVVFSGPADRFQLHQYLSDVDEDYHGF